MTQNSFRKHLSMPGMLSEVRKCFDNVPDLVVSRGITQSDCLMTELAVFSLKMTSMLSFDEKIRLDESSVPAQNFRSLFGVDRVPSDTHGCGNALTMWTPAVYGPPLKTFLPVCNAERFLRTGPCSGVII